MEDQFIKVELRELVDLVVEEMVQLVDPHLIQQMEQMVQLTQVVEAEVVKDQYLKPMVEQVDQVL